MSGAELRGLLLDCLTLWGIDGRVAAAEMGMEIRTTEGLFIVQPAPLGHVLKWTSKTPATP